MQKIALSSFSWLRIALLTSFVLDYSIVSSSIIFIFPSTSLAVRSAYKAFNLILAFKG